jgi:hypothetical protein
MISATAVVATHQLLCMIGTIIVKFTIAEALMKQLGAI